MMINFNAYFNSGSSYSSKEFLLVYTIFIWFLILINLFILLKIRFSKQSDSTGKSFLVTTIIWLNIWNFGEMLLTNVQLFTNFKLFVFLKTYDCLIKKINILEKINLLDKFSISKPFYISVTSVESKNCYLLVFTQFYSHSNRKSRISGTSSHTRIFKLP